ncbi:MAG: hypothetical protein H7X92_13255 [Chitinophagales bacterium]|nr:hypothetical protein [Hyphomicrobiales bacterium]
MFGLFRLLGLAALWEFFKRREAGKRIGRAAVGVGAAVIAIALFFVVSRFLTTFDDIESQTIRIVYGVLVTIIFGGLFGFLYFYFRTPGAAAKKPQQLHPPSVDRLQALFAKHGIMQGAGSSGRAHKGKANAPVVIAGLRESGKTEVIAALAQAGVTDIAELPALSVWAPENEEGAEMAAGARLAIFVADQDLRNYEVEFVKAVHAYGRDVTIAIDKSDRLTTSDREEIAASIAAKFEGAKRQPEVVFIASAPLPVNAVVVSADGTEREETRTRKADIAALLDRIKG